MSEPHPTGPVEAKRSGCQWLVLIVGGLIMLAVVAIISLVAYIDLFYRKEKKLHQQTVLKAIRVALTSYEVDYGYYPIPESDWHGPDVSLRTRGPILPALLGQDATLNPKKIKFIDFPAAKDRKFGLWQDGGEWVLSDRWGEPYYIVLDTNKDGVVANPEPATKFLPAMLPVDIIVYSSGPDRDPKTWHDNICSWRSR